MWPSVLDVERWSYGKAMRNHCPTVKVKRVFLRFALATHLLSHQLSPVVGDRVRTSGRVASQRLWCEEQ